MEEGEKIESKKKTKHTIGVSLEAYKVVESLAGPGKKFKTIKNAATDLILWSNLAVKEATIAKEEAEKKVHWLQTDVERLTEREKMLTQEGRSARAALGVLEDKFGLYKFLLYATWIVFGVVVVVKYVFSI